MLCDVCKMNDAAVFLTQIVDGKMQKVNLCEGCSKEKGVQDPTGFALADLLLGIGAAEEIEKGGSSTRCPVCGFTQADFKKTGRLGCSSCYLAFADGLNSLLKAMHKGTSHGFDCSWVRIFESALSYAFKVRGEAFRSTAR